MPFSTNETGDLRLHERLRQHADALPQHISILLLEELANQRRQMILGFAVASTPPGVLLLPERTHGKMRDGGLSRLRPGLIEFPPSPGTLPRPSVRLLFAFVAAVVFQNATARRQLLLPVSDNYFCRRRGSKGVPPTTWRHSVRVGRLVA